MKKLKNYRIIPYSTLFIVPKQFEIYSEILKEIKLWVVSDNFPNNSIATILDIETGKYVKITKENNKEKIVSKSIDTSFFSILNFIKQENTSLLIDLCGTIKSKIFTFLSFPASKVGAYSIFSTPVVNHRISRKKVSPNFSLKEVAPFLFNKEDMERFDYATTKNFTQQEIEQLKKEAMEMENQKADDLGKLCENFETEILWIPNQNSIKQVWKDFIKITFYAEKLKAKINFFVKDEETLKKTSSVFYIKGRKIDFDKYLTVVVGEENFEALKTKSEKIIFSSPKEELFDKANPKMELIDEIE